MLVSKYQFIGLYPLRVNINIRLFISQTRKKIIITKLKKGNSNIYVLNGGFRKNPPPKVCHCNFSPFWAS